MQWITNLFLTLSLTGILVTPTFSTLTAESTTLLLVNQTEIVSTHSSYDQSNTSSTTQTSPIDSEKPEATEYTSTTIASKASTKSSTDESSKDEMKSFEVTTRAEPVSDSIAKSYLMSNSERPVELSETTTNTVIAKGNGTNINSLSSLTENFTTNYNLSNGASNLTSNSTYKNMSSTTDSYIDKNTHYIHVMTEKLPVSAESSNSTTISNERTLWNTEIPQNQLSSGTFSTSQPSVTETDVDSKRKRSVEKKMNIDKTSLNDTLKSKNESDAYTQETRSDSAYKYVTSSTEEASTVPGVFTSIESQLNGSYSSDKFSKENLFNESATEAIEIQNHTKCTEKPISNEMFVVKNNSHANPNSTIKSEAECAEVQLPKNIATIPDVSYALDQESNASSLNINTIDDTSDSITSTISSAMKQTDESTEVYISNNKSVKSNAKSRGERSSDSQPSDLRMPSIKAPVQKNNHSVDIENLTAVSEFSSLPSTIGGYFVENKSDNSVTKISVPSQYETDNYDTSTPNDDISSAKNSEVSAHADILSETPETAAEKYSSPLKQVTTIALPEEYRDVSNKYDLSKSEISVILDVSSLPSALYETTEPGVATASDVKSSSLYSSQSISDNWSHDDIISDLVTAIVPPSSTETNSKNLVIQASENISVYDPDTMVDKFLVEKDHLSKSTTPFFHDNSDKKSIGEILESDKSDIMMNDSPPIDIENDAKPKGNLDRNPGSLKEQISIEKDPNSKNHQTKITDSSTDTSIKSKISVEYQLGKSSSQSQPHAIPSTATVSIIDTTQVNVINVSEIEHEKSMTRVQLNSSIILSNGNLFSPQTNAPDKAVNGITVLINDSSTNPLASHVKDDSLGNIEHSKSTVGINLAKDSSVNVAINGGPINTNLTEPDPLSNGSTIIHLQESSSSAGSEENQTVTPVSAVSTEASTRGYRIRKPKIRGQGDSDFSGAVIRRPTTTTRKPAPPKGGEAVSIFSRKRTRIASITSSTTAGTPTKYTFRSFPNRPLSIVGTEVYSFALPPTTTPTTTTTEEEIEEEVEEEIVELTEDHPQEMHPPTFTDDDDVTLIKIAGATVVNRGLRWKKQLNTRTSPQFKEQKQRMHKTLEKIFRGSVVGQNLWKLEIDGFIEAYPGSRSVVVDYSVYFVKTDDLLEEPKLVRSFNERLVNNTFSRYTFDPAYTQFEILEEQRLKEPTDAPELEPPVPQWAIAVIVIGAASFIFIVLFAAVTVYGRHHVRRRYASKLDDDLERSVESREWEKKVCASAAYENLAADVVYDVDDSGVENAKRKYVPPNPPRNPRMKHYDSWRTEWTVTPKRNRLPVNHIIY